ncbi:Hpt domain-containing protein [Telmatospirillum siberiense]|nr:Hpt domain-containing protein [Telmatospirillum siberiense]
MATRDTLDILLLGTACEDMAAGLRQRHYRVFPVSRTEAAVAMLNVRAFDVILLAGEPADMGTTDAVVRLRGGIGATAAVTPLVVCDSSEHGSELALAAGADRALDTEAIIEWLAGLSSPADVEANDPCVGVALPETMTGHNLLRLLGETLRQQRAALDPAVFRPEHLADIAHRLKGSAANFGYAALGSVARDAMRFSEDPQLIVELAGKLRLEIEISINDIDHRLKLANK